VPVQYSTTLHLHYSALLYTTVHFIIAACESMISGSCMCPGDILTASNGKTIEASTVLHCTALHCTALSIVPCATLRVGYTTLPHPGCARL